MSDNSGDAAPTENSAKAAPLDRAVFFGSTGVLALTVALTALMPNTAERFFQATQNLIVANASWYYVLTVALILLSTLAFALTRFGEIKLGPDHSEPEYSLVSWFAMLFAAGMGIGLMFFGVAEPVMHFVAPPQGPGGTVESAEEAMKITFFHWGLHAWAIYGIVALMLAYFCYRHGLPLTLRSALYPLIGDRIYGPLGTAVDIFAIVSTTFGVATSLGFGVDQISSGLNYLFGVPSSNSVRIVLVILTTGLATISVVLGLDAGIKRLSEINIVLAVALLLAMLALGPTVYLLQMFMQNTGGYLAEIVGKTFNLYAYEPTDWLGGWTIFYWGWWISWAPFVGLFIARISRGRTLREFVFGILLGPAMFTLLWMTVFGNSAIDLILQEGHTALGEAVQADSSVALFQFFEYFPASELLSGIAVVMVVVFFVTSADSGAMVLNMLSSNGRDDTPMARRIYWMVMIGVSAIVLMLAGGLAALQTAAVASALPFSVAVLAAIWGFGRALQIDHAKRMMLQGAAFAAPGSGGADAWKQRLDRLLKYPKTREVNQYIGSVVRAALDEFGQELRKRDVQSRIQASSTGDAVRLEVMHGDEIDFVYEVNARSHPVPDDALLSVDEAERERYSRAEVHLSDGSQDYCIMGWTREQVINDILAQYQKHLHFLHVLR